MITSGMLPLDSDVTDFVTTEDSVRAIKVKIDAKRPRLIPINKIEKSASLHDDFEKIRTNVEIETEPCAMIIRVKDAVDVDFAVLVRVPLASPDADKRKWSTCTASIRDRIPVGQVREVIVTDKISWEHFWSQVSEKESIFNNIVMLTDSYKVTHHLQYPPGTTKIYSYFECRGGLYEEVCFFGLQYFLKKYLVGPVVTMSKIDEAEAYFKIHFSHPVWGYDEKLFNRAGWERIVLKHNGHLPIRIKAVPEGTVVPYKNVLFTLENTDATCYWLTNYLETLLVQVWYPTTVSTQSREQKKIIMQYLTETGSEDVIKNGGHLFKLHDFGFRGVSSVESAAIGGAGHLVNFLGTDTMAALMCAKDFYGETLAGFSIPASEHSTMTSWTSAKEVDAMRNMLEQYPKGLVACVSDSFDIFRACEEYWGTELKAKIESRDGQLVVRPDSGELPGIVLQVLEKLESKFGHTVTSTGHKLLPPCIRVIQGDGIDIGTLQVILQAMKDAGWGADNLAFGSGGALLQKLNRDTQKFAFKCSYAMMDGKGVDVFKDPITDPGKKSKKGRLTLEFENGKWTTTTEGHGSAEKDMLVTVFRNGELLVDDTFGAIRGRASQGL